MNKTVRKDKKKKSTCLNNNDNNRFCSGQCTYSKNGDNYDDVVSRKSRVTIFGQLGLTEDDRYILNCAATLNNKPIQTNVMYVDNNTGFDLQDKNRSEKFNTQSTQVYSNFFEKKPLQNLKNKSVQCYCNTAQHSNVEKYASKTEIELKQCKSPLVVISVYQREDSIEIIDKSNPEKNIRRKISPHNKQKATYQVNNLREEEISPRIESIYRAIASKSNRSRSTSPISAVVKEINKKPDSKAMKINNQIKQGLLRQRNKSDHKIDSFKNIKKSTNGENDIQETNKKQIKKVLVNTFLKNVAKTSTSFGRNTKNVAFDPQEDASKITIDINGENAHYNVLLEQRQFDTGICVKKSIKQQSHDGEKCGNSRKKSFSSPNNLLDKHREHKTRFIKKSSNVPILLPPESKLNVRDSLEICHRREKRSSSRIEPKVKEKKDNFIKNKHYRGDNCSISDPIERDLEIRKLLGVLRNNRSKDKEKAGIKNFEKENGGTCIENKCLTKKMLKVKCKNKKSESILPLICCTQDIQDRNLYLQISKKHINKQKEIHPLEHQVKVTKHSNFIKNNVSKKMQKVLPSSIKKENKLLNSNEFFVFEIEKKTKPIILTKKQYEKLKRIIKYTLSKKSTLEKRKKYNINNIDCNVVSIRNIKIKRKSRQTTHFDRETQTERALLKCHDIQYDSHFQLINKNMWNVKVKNKSRRAVSSMEIGYACVKFAKHVSNSSKCFGDSFQTNTLEKDNKSLLTIFKGTDRRKRVTPNLGTSALSLNSESRNSSVYSIKPPPYSGDGKIKKPFLRRLLSCLVMRSPQMFVLKGSENPKKQLRRNFSLDSYNISTSLGPLEMSSSLYDTSASFHSNHTIMPIIKTRKGFFNSVRGLLTIRKT